MDRWLTYAQGNKSCFRLDEKNIKIIINNNEKCHILFKDQENCIRIQYKLDEQLEYAFYVNVNSERIITKQYDTNNEMKFNAKENHYTIIAFVRDKFKNTVAKEFQLSCIEKQSLNLLNNSYLKDYLKKSSKISIENHKILVTVGDKKLDHLKFAYYIQLDKQNIHKETYSGKHLFELPISEPGQYEVIIFCIDLLGEKFSFNKQINYYS